MHRPLHCRTPLPGFTQDNGQETLYGVYKGQRVIIAVYPVGERERILKSLCSEKGEEDES